MLGNHLLGLYEKALPGELCWEERFAAVKRLGFDFIELSVDESDERIARLYTGAQERRRLLRAAENTGVRIQSLCLSAHRRFPFGSANAHIRQKGRDIAERSIAYALDLGIRVIQVAGHDVYYEPSSAQSRAAFLDGLKAFVSEAEKHQVMLAIEIMDTDFISSVTAYQKIKAEVPSPWLALYPDLGNLSAWNKNVSEQLELGRNEIVAVHIKDTLAPCGTFAGQFKSVQFGSGCVDFPAAFRKLEDIGFCGPYLIEMWCRQGSGAEHEIRSALSFVRRQYEKGLSE